ncbi:uncharacterized protein LOC134191650 [Corticium candelabrum]|uniref:uncharacterized protein LOC134191650 n=1 Tax=Corticium candelabrum TaxID=121492 RepID=UPI002E258F37|nr:uncharacterized protein LOC134191650 [Corticium candelabrum]
MASRQVSHSGTKKETEESPVKYKDIVLTDIPCSPSSPQKYARKLLDEVYTKEEMASGLFNKIGFSTKEVLSPTRKTLIWKCLEKKYKEAFLKTATPAINESLNQKCRDAKKHIKRKIIPQVQSKRDNYCSSSDSS